ncbi:MAG: type II restriction endonuclease [Actinomycetota bacterium]|nr:type II restriction endonuclease [Actinomycetota bacterium]
MEKHIYASCLGISDVDALISLFHETLIDTNRGHNFFVAWEKVYRHTERHKIECNILNSLIGSKDFDNELRALLRKYPEALPVIPILVALRPLQLQVIKDFLDTDSDIVKYSFVKRELLSNEIEDFVEFFDKTGLKQFFESFATRSIFDYLTGVEVGLDTHARKNRSGAAMELALKPIIEQINAQFDGRFEILFQRKFSFLSQQFGIPVSPSIKDRKADFVLIDKHNQQVVNIEVNFYSGTGSKPQEIVDSYIHRQDELKENGFEFIWVTDGIGWSGQKNQIRKGFEKIEHLLNLHFVRRGLLEHILAALA